VSRVSAARALAVCLSLLIVVPAAAQESQFQSDLRREHQDISGSCGNGFSPKALVGCLVTVATDDPFHVAMGSLPPLNGTGFGLAFAEHYTPNEHWRLSWNADGVAATSGSWRAGAYVKIIHIPDRPAITVRRAGASQSTQRTLVTINEYPVFNVYAQTISLDTLTVAAGQGTFSEKQTILGTNAIYPLTNLTPLQPLHPSLVGAVNGRFLSTRSSTPSLSAQPSFAQFEEGLRLKPSIPGDRLQLNYLFDFQQFATSADTHASFHRWSVDLKHEFPLYSTVSSKGPKETNGPDECFASVGSPGCPPVSYSRNLEGSISVRLLAIGSASGSDSSVPFYFQPTLGGSDIDGQRLLSGYDDYRFRGANLIALQESVEHSVWGPIGVYALVEQGKVTPQGTGLGLSDLAKSFAVGLTIRAGGFPMVNLTFAWGTNSHHIIGSLDPSLLGGSGRPSLY
jgi:hypothetical protein